MKNAFFVFATIAACILGLYIVDDAKPHGVKAIACSDGQNVKRCCDVSEKIQLYSPDTRTDEEKKYPELWATDAIIVTFSAEWCGWCKQQAGILSGPSKAYYVFIAKIEEKDEIGRTVKTRWGELAEKWDVSNIPVTFIVEKGKPVKRFDGYTAWSKIKPHAEKARRNEDDKKKGFNIGPLRFDWDEGVNVDWERRNRRSKRKF